MIKIKHLESSQSEIISITPDKTIKEAITLMLTSDFSQIPVINGNKISGIISWKSIGIFKNLGNDILKVRDCIDNNFKVYQLENDLQDAISDILKHEFILVKNKKNEICGIVTLFDISKQYHLLSEPFIELESLENNIRTFLKTYLPLEYKFKNEVTIIEKGKENIIDEQLTFGDYNLIFQSDNNWKKFEEENINLNKSIIVKKLEEIRLFRNNLMHFKLDDSNQIDLNLLRRMNKIFSIINLKKNKFV
jgi:CBS-domain-containing membrane protein